MIEGSCHCGAIRWEFEGDPGSATACNCTTCRRYAALWIYDYENERIRVSGVTSTYERKRENPTLRYHFCPNCGAMAYWRAVNTNEEGRRRIAVNIRLAEPDAVADLPIDHFEGLDSFEDLPRDGRCVRDYWY